MSHATNNKVLETGIILGLLADSAAATKLRVTLNAFPNELGSESPQPPPKQTPTGRKNRLPRWLDLRCAPFFPSRDESLQALGFLSREIGDFGDVRGQIEQLPWSQPAAHLLLASRDAGGDAAG